VTAGREVRRTINPFTGLPEVELRLVRELEPDPCVVETAPVARILLDFVGSWCRTRPQHRNRFVAAEERDRPQVTPLGPYESLALETSLPAAVFEEATKPGKNRYTELRVVDALVAAGVVEHMAFYDGTFTIRPNPKVPAERSRECCGGSERLAC
jgi:hypothetical protein